MTLSRRNVFRSAYLLVSLVLLIPGISAAAQDMPRPADDLGAALVRSGAALLLILGLFFLLVYVMKRFLPGAFTPTKNSPDSPSKIDVMATRQLGPKRFLHVVRVGHREFLIGVGDQGMTPLGEWEIEDDAPPEPGTHNESTSKGG